MHYSCVIADSSEEIFKRTMINVKLIELSKNIIKYVLFNFFLNISFSVYFLIFKAITKDEIKGRKIIVKRDKKIYFGKKKNFNQECAKTFA